MPTVVVEQLRASVGALSAERRRLECEVMKLEQKAMTTNTDDLIRRLKAEIDAVDAGQAEKRALLARAEAQRQTLARDRAEAQATAHLEATAACKARLASLLDDELRLIAQKEALAREQVDLTAQLLAVVNEARAEAGRLTQAGVVPSSVEVLQRLSLREAKMMSKAPGCRHRYGHLTLPSGSFGLVPNGLTWAEDEARYLRDARVLIEPEAE